MDFGRDKVRDIHEPSIGERRVLYGRHHERHFPGRGWAQCFERSARSGQRAADARSRTPQASTAEEMQTSPEVAEGSKCEELRVSKSSPLCPNKRTFIRRGVTSLMGPFPDSCTAAKQTLFDHFVRAASTDAGRSRPSALAVFRLTTNSYLVGVCTGRSTGFAPALISAIMGHAGAAQLSILFVHSSDEVAGRPSP